MTALVIDWEVYDVKEREMVYKKIKDISECGKIYLEKCVNNNKQ